MVSTGEVGCLGYNLNEAIIKSMLSVGYNIPKKNIFFYINSLKERRLMLNYIKLLIRNNYKIYCNFFYKKKFTVKKLMRLI